MTVQAVVVGATAALLLVGCQAAASLQPAPQPLPLDGMTLNLETMQVVTPSWRSELIDCSDEAFQCLEAPGYFLVSMPRSCSRQVSWQAGGHGYRAIAPAPHYGLPSGSYMSMKYPHVHWRFGAPIERGFHRWARTVDTPMESAWDTNVTVEAYEVRTIGGDDWFRC